MTMLLSVMPNLFQHPIEILISSRLSRDDKKRQGC